MAYLPESELEKQKRLEAEGQQTQNGITLSSPSGTVVQRAPGTPTNGAPKGPSQSGAYTNLQSYLDVNKEQSAALGADVGNKVKQAGTDARNQMQNASDSFKKQVDDASLANRDTAVQEAKDLVNTGYNQVYGGNYTDDQLNRFKDIGTASYQGPSSYTTAKAYDNDGNESGDLYSTTQQKINKANQYSDATTSDAGRLTLLQEMYAKPTYSRGQQSLDNLFLGTSAEGRQALDEARVANQGLDERFASDLNTASNLASSRKSEIADIAKQTQDYLGSQRNSKNANVDTELAKIQGQWDNEYNHYLKLLQDYKDKGGGDLELTAEEAARLGVLRELEPSRIVSQKMQTPGSGQVQYADTQIFNNLKDVAASKYLDKKVYDASKVVSKDQFAQLAALDQLANQLGLDSISKFSDIDQAGTLGLHNNLDASLFGRQADIAKNDFIKYSKGANFTGTGEDSEGYQSSWLSNDNVTRNASFSANLAKLLEGAGYTNNNAVGVDTNNLLVPGAVNSLVSNTFSGDIESGLNTIWGNSGKAEAERAAQQNANNQALASLYAQIEAALQAQGFYNKVKIKG